MPAGVTGTVTPAQTPQTTPLVAAAYPPAETFATITPFPNPIPGFAGPETWLVSPSTYILGKSPVPRITFSHLPPNAAINIYSLSGRLVVSIQHSSGSGSETWDISDTASGIYFYTIQAPLGHKTGKLTILK
jgi:hypothetical protein